jgi:hypothetical protein
MTIGKANTIPVLSRHLVGIDVTKPLVVALSICLVRKSKPMRIELLTIFRI